MSTTSEVIPKDQTSSPGHQAGALAFHTANATSDPINSDLKRATLVLAANALALMYQNKSTELRAITPSSSSAALSPPKAQIHSQDAQWLYRQIVRDEQAHYIELPFVPPLDEGADNYMPQSLIIDEEESAAAPLPREFYSYLAEPLPPISTPPPRESFSYLAEPLPPTTVRQSYESFSYLAEPVLPTRKPLPNLVEQESFIHSHQDEQVLESCSIADATKILSNEAQPALYESTAPQDLVCKGMFDPALESLADSEAPLSFPPPTLENSSLPHDFENTHSIEPGLYLSPMLPDAPASDPKAEILSEPPHALLAATLEADLETALSTEFVSEPSPEPVTQLEPIFEAASVEEVVSETTSAPAVPQRETFNIAPSAEVISEPPHALLAATLEADLETTLLVEFVSEPPLVPAAQLEPVFEMAPSVEVVDSHVLDAPPKESSFNPPLTAEQHHFWQQLSDTPPAPREFFSYLAEPLIPIHTPPPSLVEQEPDHPRQIVKDPESYFKADIADIFYTEVQLALYESATTPDSVSSEVLVPVPKSLADNEASHTSSPPTLEDGSLPSDFVIQQPLKPGWYITPTLPNTDVSRSTEEMVSEPNPMPVAQMEPVFEMAPPVEEISEPLHTLLAAALEPTFETALSTEFVSELPLAPAAQLEPMLEAVSAEEFEIELLPSPVAQPESISKATFTEEVVNELTPASIVPQEEEGEVAPAAEIISEPSDTLFATTLETDLETAPSTESPAVAQEETFEMVPSTEFVSEPPLAPAAQLEPVFEIVFTEEDVSVTTPTPTVPQEETFEMAPSAEFVNESPLAPAAQLESFFEQASSEEAVNELPPAVLAATPEPVFEATFTEEFAVETTSAPAVPQEAAFETAPATEFFESGILYEAPKENSFNPPPTTAPNPFWQRIADIPPAPLSFIPHPASNNSAAEAKTGLRPRAPVNDATSYKINPIIQPSAKDTSYPEVHSPKTTDIKDPSLARSLLQALRKQWA